MTDLTLLTWFCLRKAVDTVWARRSDQRGEGVISAAIAVLIMAFLGAAMWAMFKEMFDKTQTNTKTQVDQIGS